MQEKANQEYKEIAERMKIQAQDTEQEIKEEFKKIQNFLEEAKLRALKEAKKDITEKMKENIKNISKDISMMSKEIEDTEKELDGHDIAFLKNFKTIKERVQSKLQDPERFSGRFTVVSNHIAEVKSLSSRVQQIIMQDINPDHMEKTGDQTGGSDLTAGKSSVQMDSVNKQTMNTKQLKIKIHVVVSGETLKSHQTFMARLDMSLKECNLEDCRVVMIFCSIFQLEADIKKAVRNIPDDKPIILVLMHHSYSPDHVDDIPITAPRSNVVKVVQCVFHETVGLLECELNQQAVRAVGSELKMYC
ncbi:uncharacterized protein LOC108934901 isoform X2 [Scleropages formosus]|nr:uncharacterized protein LOC108934901 isoform X2 [Scleropages formosus]